MSRYTLEPRADNSDIDHGVIGWDRPLETFFAQVFPKASPEENAIVWVGTDFRELRTPEAAIKAIEPYMSVPEHIRGQLLSDFADQPARHPEPALTQIRVEVQSGPGLALALIGRRGNLVRQHLVGYIVKLDTVNGETAQPSAYIPARGLRRI